jgi:hypothetical protein
VIVQGVEFKDLKNGKWETFYNFNFYGYNIPKGFTTDFRTTPNWIEHVVKKFLPKFNLVYVLHDYIYKNSLISRLKADNLQREIMLLDKLNFTIFQVGIIYSLVRIFGWYYYQKYKKRNNTQ